MNLGIVCLNVENFSIFAIHLVTLNIIEPYISLLNVQHILTNVVASHKVIPYCNIKCDLFVFYLSIQSGNFCQTDDVEN